MQFMNIMEIQQNYRFFIVTINWNSLREISSSLTLNQIACTNYTDRGKNVKIHAIPNEGIHKAAFFWGGESVRLLVTVTRQTSV